MISHESPPINPLEFPREYFDAQVHFALRWSDLSDEDPLKTLETKTALYRRVTESAISLEDADGRWNSLISQLHPYSAAEDVTNLFFEAYSSDPSSLYVPPETTRALGYDYMPESETVKIHFKNPVRGERPLSDENMNKRREEFRELLEDVQLKHPEAALLMSATWLRSTSRYRALSPPNIAPEQDLMSPSMKFGGNSVWGQFIDASGNANRRVYNSFIGSALSARTIKQLIDSFPYKTLLAVDPIDLYYNYYNVSGAPYTGQTSHP